MLTTDGVGSSDFARTEDALRAWARERAQMKRSIARSLQVPGRSSMSTMLQQQRVFDRKRRKAGRRSVLQCGQCTTIYLGAECPKCRAIALGFADTDLTARGKQTLSMAPPAVITQFSSRSAAVAAIVKRLLPWMRDAVLLAYGSELPDRICARELRMPREDFTRQRRAAVSCVALMLAQRNAAAVHSVRLTSG